MSAIKKVINLPTKQTTKSTSSVWPFATDYVEDWAYWDNVFTPEECKELIKIGESKILTPGTIFKEGVDLTKQALGGIQQHSFTLDGFGGNSSFDSNPWSMKVGNQDEDLTWLIK